MNTKHFLIVCYLILISCGFPIYNIQRDYQFEQGYGIALLSITSSGDCGYAYFVEVRDINRGDTCSINMQSDKDKNDWTIKNPKRPLSPKEYVGRLVSIELPQGFYEVYQIEGISGNYKVYSKDKISIKFTVDERKVNYLGNLYFYINIFYLKYRIKNKSIRDLSIFLEKYPQFNRQDIISNFLSIDVDD